MMLGCFSYFRDAASARSVLMFLASTFFFQAEDGIRDADVTGVQTCALPIWLRRGKPANGLAVLHFDAHLDTVDQVWGEKWTHASPFIRAIEEKLIDPKRMLSIGIRGPLNTLQDRKSVV